MHVKKLLIMLFILGFVLDASAIRGSMAVLATTGAAVAVGRNVAELKYSHLSPHEKTLESCVNEINAEATLWGLSTGFLVGAVLVRRVPTVRHFFASCRMSKIGDNYLVNLEQNGPEEFISDVDLYYLRSAWPRMTAFDDLVSMGDDVIKARQDVSKAIVDVDKGSPLYNKIEKLSFRANGLNKVILDRMGDLKTDPDFRDRRSGYEEAMAANKQANAARQQAFAAMFAAISYVIMSK